MKEEIDVVYKYEGTRAEHANCPTSELDTAARKAVKFWINDQGR